MRVRRFLLVTAALSTAAGAYGCKKEAFDNPPPPGNPKGMTYDADAGKLVPLAPLLPPPPQPVEAGPIPPPGNPKGSHYDAGGTSKTGL